MLAAERRISSRSRRYWITLLVIVGVAFALRLAVSVALKEHYPPVSAPSKATDTYTYQEYARQILDGTFDYSKGFYYQPFYYSVWLPVLYACSGRSPWGVILGQSLLGAAAVLLTGLAFARLFGRRCGLLAAAFLALSRMHIFYTPFTLIAVLQSFWMALLLYLAVLAIKRKSWWLWLLTGLVCGAANATRGNIILFLPFLVFLLVWTQRREMKHVLLSLFILLVCFLLPQLPFAIVNYRAHGKWIGASSAGAAVLGLGNTPEAPPGGREPGDAGPMEYPESYGRWLAQDKAQGTAHVPLSHNILEWLEREPGAYLELKFRTFLLFWHRMEIPNNVSLLSRGKPIPVALIHLPILLDFWLIGGLGFAGLFFMLMHHRRRPGAWLALCLILVYCASIVLFYMLARFRVPALPVICGFAGLTVSTFWRRWRRFKKDHRSLLIHGGILGLSLLFVAFGFDLYRLGWEVPVMRLVRPDGVRIPYADKETVKDNGPMSFGGWIPTDDSQEFLIQKRLIPLQSLDAYSRIQLRICILAPAPTTLLIGGNGFVSRQSVKRGLQWLTVELPSKQCVYYSKAEGLNLKLHLQAAPGGRFAVLLDHQRDYHRTVINRMPVDGELVMELNLFRK